MLQESTNRVWRPEDYQTLQAFAPIKQKIMSLNTSKCLVPPSAKWTTESTVIRNNRRLTYRTSSEESSAVPTISVIQAEGSGSLLGSVKEEEVASIRVPEGPVVRVSLQEDSVKK